MVNATDLQIISNFAVALGTFFLAYYSYKSIVSSKKQLDLLQNQVKITLSQNQPYLSIINKKINGNTIELNISNIGHETAFDIAISSYFFNIQTIPKEWMKFVAKITHNPIDESTIEDFYLIHKNQDFKYEDNDPPKSLNFIDRIRYRHINDKVKIVHPYHAITYLQKAALDPQPILLENESGIHFECEPYFYVSDKFSEESLGLLFYTFDKLKQFLTENGVTDIGIILSLLCKDKIIPISVTPFSVKNCFNLSNV